jgi:hypothetical protein
MGPDVIFSEFTARLPAGLLETSQEKARLGLVLQVGPGRADPARARRASGLNTSGRASTNFFRAGPKHAHLLKRRPSTALKHDGLTSGRAGPDPARKLQDYCVVRHWKQKRLAADRDDATHDPTGRGPWLLPAGKEGASAQTDELHMEAYAGPTGHLLPAGRLPRPPPPPRLPGFLPPGHPRLRADRRGRRAALAPLLGRPPRQHLPRDEAGGLDGSCCCCSCSSSSYITCSVPLCSSLYPVRRAEC